MYYYLNDEKKWPKSGTGQPFISPSVVKNLMVPFPSLPIQQKIVQILDTIQEVIDIHDKIIEKTKELKKSLANLLFHYGLAGLRVKELMGSRVGELTSSEIEKLGLKLKKTEIGEIPENWEVVRLGKVCEIVYGVQASVSELKEEIGRIPILTNKNISDEGTIDLANLNFYPEDLIDSKKHLLKKGDIIFNWRSGSVEHVGKSALFNLEGKFTFASFLLRFRPKSNIINSYFLNSYFHKIRKEGFLKFFAHQASINQSLNASISSNIPIPLPPLPEQQEIAEILQTVDQKIEIERRKKELYEELFKTVLNKIMNQEIDVESVDF
jgi:type I restriction enzyme S subunit